MQNDKIRDIDCVLKSCPDIPHPNGLEKALLAGFDTYQRQRRRKLLPRLGWFMPTAGSLASLSVGVFAGLITAPASADSLGADYNEGVYDVIPDWQMDTWIDEASFDE